MNYIKEINGFYDWLMYNSLPTGAIALWHALMAINNKAGWAEEFTVANIVLQGMTGLSRQGVDRARNTLIQKGLIQYKKGTSNQAGKYKIISFDRKKVGTEHDTKVVTENLDRKKVGTGIDTPDDTKVVTDNLECKIIGTEHDTKRAQGDTQGGHKSSTLYKHKQNKTKLNNNHDDDDYDYDNDRVSDSKNLFAVFEQEFGRILSPALAEKLISYVQDDGMEESVVIDAIKRAKLQGKENMAYVDGILRNWRGRNVKTLADVQRLDREYENRKQGRERARGPVQDATRKHNEKREKQKQSKYPTLKVIGGQEFFG